MNTLQEEREAIVDGLINDTQQDGFCSQRRSALLKALLSHEEKVVARVREEVLNDALQEIENARLEFNPARHHSDPEAIFDRCRNYVGYLITQYSDPSLTLPITDEV